MIQAVTKLDPLVGGHQQPLQGSRFHHPKKLTKNCQAINFSGAFAVSFRVKYEFKGNSWENDNQFAPWIWSHKIPGIGGIQNAQTEGPKTKDSFLIYPGQSPRFANAIFTFVWVWVTQVLDACIAYWYFIGLCGCSSHARFWHKKTRFANQETLSGLVLVACGHGNVVAFFQFQPFKITKTSRNSYVPPSWAT